ncbi:MAG TPA: hypothetical protein VFC56_09200, partial [Stellaceae bacterium]|nr:hypothetical protein [Stellaceae bacterium]
MRTDTTDVNTLPVTAPVRDAAAEHIELLTGSPDTPMHFRVFPDDKKSADKFGQDFYGTVAEVWPEIQNWQSQGCGVFVIPNEGGANDAAITHIRTLFIDMDGQHPPERWHVQPDFFVERDDLHRHAYWLVADCPVAEFKTAQRRLAACYGSDPKVCNPSRVMRLAGTLHLKEPAHPRHITVEDCTLLGSGKPHTLA